MTTLPTDSFYELPKSSEGKQRKVPISAGHATQFRVFVTSKRQRPPPAVDELSAEEEHMSTQPATKKGRRVKLRKPC